jgi:hypothetical protein
LLAARIEDAGHPNFFTNDSFHFLTVYPRKVIQDIPVGTGLQSWFIIRPFPLSAPGQAVPFVRDSEVPVTNKPRRACLYVIADREWLETVYESIYLILRIFFSELFSPACGGIER